jgi:predicted aspartyl protease
MMITLPFRLVGGAQPLVVVSAQLNGSGPFDFALDTGAAAPVVAPELARRVGLRIDQTREAAGAGGRVSVGLARVENFAVAKASRPDVPVIVTADIERIGAAVGARLDGVIGYEFLRHFRLRIDYRRQVLSLADGPPDGEGHPSPRAEIPLQLAHPAKPLIVVPALVNGTGPHPFALDTGASMCVLAGHLAARIGIRTEAGPAMTGGGGAIPTSAGFLQSVAIEAAVVANLPVAVGDFLTALGKAVGIELVGIIGYNYLREFLVTIDYPGATVRLD